MWKKTIGILIAFSFTGCGGGGNSENRAPLLSLTLAPVKVETKLLQGLSKQIFVSATVQGKVSGVVNVIIVDDAGVLKGGLPPVVRTHSLGA